MLYSFLKIDVLYIYFMERSFCKFDIEIIKNNDNSVIGNDIYIVIDFFIEFSYLIFILIDVRRIYSHDIHIERRKSKMIIIIHQLIYRVSYLNALNFLD